MKLMPSGDHYLWYCEWCDTRNMTLWTEEPALLHGLPEEVSRLRGDAADQGREGALLSASEHGVALYCVTLLLKGRSWEGYCFTFDESLLLNWVAVSATVALVLKDKTKVITWS